MGDISRSLMLLVPVEAVYQKIKSAFPLVVSSPWRWTKDVPNSLIVLENKIGPRSEFELSLRRLTENTCELRLKAGDTFFGIETPAEKAMDDFVDFLKTFESGYNSAMEPVEVSVVSSPEVTEPQVAPKQEQVLEKIVYCPFCGAKRVEDARFCHRCGKQLSS